MKPQSPRSKPNKKNASELTLREQIDALKKLRDLVRSFESEKGERVAPRHLRR